MNNPYITQPNGKKNYLKLFQGASGSGINQLTGDVLAGPGTGSVVSVLKTLLAGGTFGDSTHTLQLVVDTKGRITGITPIGIPGLTATTMPKASDLGIVANGTDQTSALNTIFSNTNYDGIIMDFVPVPTFGSAITISGTVNCQGKTIYFWPGSYFTGSGTLNNAVISAYYFQKLFDITVSLTGSKTSTDKFASTWYGTDTTGVNDAQPALQKTSDTMIANAVSGMTRTLYMVPGTYKTNTTWMMHDWNGTTYAGQWTLNVEGNWRACFSNNNGYPLIIPTFKDGPVIGMQRGIASRIMGVCFQGVIPSLLAYDAFVQSSFAAQNTAGVRDSVYSPFAAIVIDPVTNNPATIPPDGGYPQLNGSEPGGLNWYRGTGSHGGSSGMYISNCHIIGFTVDIMISPNGDTQQTEDITIEDCFLDTANVAIAYGQGQNDNCHVIRCRSWDNVWCVVDTVTYGGGTGIMPSIHGYNVAGEVYALFNVSSNKPFNVYDFYAESFFTIGSIFCGANGSTINGNFNFGDATFQPQYHVQASNIKFAGGVMRYFDNFFNKRLRFNPQNVICENVMFDLPPFVVDQQGLQQNAIRYINCSLPGTSEVLGANNDMYFVESANVTPVSYGQFKIQDGFGIDSSGNFPPALALNYNCANFNRYINGFSGSVTITPDPTLRTASFTVSSTNALLCQNNDIVYSDNTNVVIGRISNISGTTITISEIPLNVVAGTYVLDLCYYSSAKNNLVGDTTSGQPTISNVSFVFGSSISEGFRFDTPDFPNGAYVLSYNSTTKVITMSVNSGASRVRQNFANGYPQCEVRSSKAPNDAGLTTFARALLTGTEWIDQTSSGSTSTLNKWVFNQGGYVAAYVTALSLGAAFQADYNIEPVWRVSGGSFQYFDNTGSGWTNA